MPSYSVNAINVGSFNLGESDKIITLFSAERGLIRAVAKGARKPGSKIAGRAEVLAVNKLLLANGRSLDIITQAETIENFKGIRKDLTRLSYGLYYAELTCHFGQGLGQEAQSYFELLINALRQLSLSPDNPAYLCLTFQLSLLHLVGLKPELESCLICRRRLLDYDLSIFHHDLGGAVCNTCFSSDVSPKQLRRQNLRLAESSSVDIATETPDKHLSSFFTHLTPLVWKKLILASTALSVDKVSNLPSSQNSELIEKAIQAARHLLETYIEHRAGKKMKSLGLI